MNTINGFAPMNAAHGELGEDFSTNLNEGIGDRPWSHSR